jgi:hypothetical protein
MVFKDSVLNSNYAIMFIDITRAAVYHQHCLDPPIHIKCSDVHDEDWMCWQCECMDDCLEDVNERFETNVMTGGELFPISTAKKEKEWRAL